MAGYIGSSEELVDIPGHEGQYAITRSGKVWSYPKNRGLSSNGRWLKGSNKTYPTVTLYKNGKYVYTTIHRLLAITFIPNPDNKEEVNHINGDKYDYRLENIEWATHKENMEHAWRTGLSYVSEKMREEGRKSQRRVSRSRRKFTDEQVREMRRLREENNVSWNKLSDMFGIEQASVKCIVHRNAYKDVT